MKTNYILYCTIPILVTIMPITTTIAATSQTCTSKHSNIFDGSTINANCKTAGSTDCFQLSSGGLVSVKNCAACIPGPSLLTRQVTDGITVKFCDYECTSSNCTSDQTWSAASTGYQQQHIRACINNSCTIVTTRYQCANGYYGTSSNGTSGCNPCPTWTGVYTNSARTTSARGTSNAGATETTGCFVAPGTYYDATGTFNLSSNCAYK